MPRTTTPGIYRGLHRPAFIQLCTGLAYTYQHKPLIMDHVHFAESNSDDTPLSRTLYVTNLSYASLRSDLERLFSSFGTIGRFGDRLLNSRGMAFITYYDARHATRALRALQHHMYAGFTMNIQYAKSRPEIEESYNPRLSVLVQGENTNIPKSAIVSLFQQWGDVRMVKGEPMNNGITKYVEFWDSRDAERALLAANGMRFMGSSLVVGYAPASTKSSTSGKASSPAKHSHSKAYGKMKADRRGDYDCDRFGACHRNSSNDRYDSPYTQTAHPSNAATDRFGEHIGLHKCYDQHVNVQRPAETIGAPLLYGYDSSSPAPQWEVPHPSSPVLYSPPMSNNTYPQPSSPTATNVTRINHQTLPCQTTGVPMVYPSLFSPDYAPRAASSAGVPPKTYPSLFSPDYAPPAAPATDASVNSYDSMSHYQTPDYTSPVYVPTHLYGSATYPTASLQPYASLSSAVTLPNPQRITYTGDNTVKR